MQRSEENLCESVSNMQIAETELRPFGGRHLSQDEGRGTLHLSLPR